MRRIALGLACIVAAGAYAVGCSGTGGTSNGSGGHSGSGAGATAGTSGSGNAGSGNGGSSGSGNGGSGNSGNGGSGNSGNGGSGNGGDASATGGTGGGSQDAAVPDVVFSYDGPSDDGKQEACAGTVVTAQPTPLDMYVMLDQSGSMGSDCNIGGTNTGSKWCDAINALSGFFHDSSAVGDRVALQYFMLDSGGACDGTGYDTPEIPLGYLPQIASSLDSSMNSHAPHTDTPTQAAMNGISKYTSTHQTSGRVMVGILITDGVPCCGECNDNVATIAQIPQNLYNTYGIRTFVIGMTGASFSALEQWAVAGGAASHTNYCATGYSPCHFYNVGNGDPQAFIQALKAIQQSALGCQYNMPKTDAGITDPSKLSVAYTPSGGTAQALPNAGSQAACGSNDGFYYDNNTNPTTITLCPATCTKVQAATGGQVNITVPCQGS